MPKGGRHADGGGGGCLRCYPSCLGEGQPAHPDGFHICWVCTEGMEVLSVTFVYRTANLVPIVSAIAEL